ncbi:hypothetical protein GQ55_6G020700 [Panicum hallii var. hallii]|uniref:Uncharacterized protein n=1 Tax=Panicum hallii var. hallii TaxID=1504633 RepID=A0A2T7D352_9POAL|nr:hypothetical protein GQ55_6G020700 [Panicum hallii var. hallii]
MTSLAHLAQATPAAPPRRRCQEELSSRGASLGTASAATHVPSPPPPRRQPRATTTVVASTPAYARLEASQPRCPHLRAHGVTAPKPAGHRPRPREAPHPVPGRSQPPRSSADPAVGTPDPRTPVPDPAFHAGAATSCPLRRSRWSRPPRREGEEGRPAAAVLESRTDFRRPARAAVRRKGGRKEGAVVFHPPGLPTRERRARGGGGGAIQLPRNELKSLVW